MNRNESITGQEPPNLRRTGDHTLLDPTIPAIDLYSAATQRLDKINAVSVAFMESAHRGAGALNDKDLYSLGCLYYDLSQECRAILDEIEEIHSTQP